MSTRRSLFWAVLGSGLSATARPRRRVRRSRRPAAPIRKVVLLSLDGANAGTAAPALSRREAHRRRFLPLLPGRPGGRPPDPGQSRPHLAEPHQPGDRLPRRADGDRQQPSSIPPGSPFLETVSGFAAPIDTETLWEAARRQGKRAGVISWPGADDTGPRRRADWGMTYTNTPDRPAALVTRRERPLEAASGHPEQLARPEAHDVRSAERRAAAVIARRRKAFPLTPGRWADLPCRHHPPGGLARRTPPSARSSCWSSTPAARPGSTSAAVYPFPAYPRDFAAALAGRDCFWPGPPDDDRLVDSWNGRPGIDLATWLEQSGRFARFFGDALLAAAQRPDWDLLMGYMPVIDEAEHKLQLTDPRQPGFTPERRDAFEAARTRVWQDVDRELARLLAGLDLKTTVVAVVSDHGMAPVHTHVNLNVLLQEKGLLAADADGQDPGGGDGRLRGRRRRPGPRLRRSPAAPISSPSCAPCSPAGRWRRDARRARVHPQGGGGGPPRPPQQRRSGPLPPRGLHVRGRLADGRAVSPTGVFGMHGYLSSHPEMHGIYMALGPGIAPGNAGTVRNLEVAGRVAGWLGIEKPRR